MAVKVSVQFLGGVAEDDENLTGSCTFVTIRDGKHITRILVDAGMWQGRYENFQKMNLAILHHLKLAEIDFIILTHSHNDHCGRIPMLVARGFKGRIICTEPTAELLDIMLYDSAGILLSESRYRQSRAKRHSANGKPNKSRYHEKKNGQKKPNQDTLNFKPLFYALDVEQTLELVKNGGEKYESWIKLSAGISVKFYPSGHVLGGAICVIKIGKAKPDNKPIYLGFSGDLGRQDGIILPPPVMPTEPLDYWFTESTYGGISHPPRDEEIETLKDMVMAAIEKNSKIIVPSFSLERAQEIIYLLSYFMSQGLLPPISIYLDSPLAKKITGVFKKNWISPMFKDQGLLGFNPFDLDENRLLRVIETDLDSVELSKKQGPYLVIAGSGMCNAGRVRNYLRENLSKTNAIVCLVGYMAAGSLGRKLADGYPIVKMNGEEINVRAGIIKFASFSAHADGPFLAGWIKQLVGSSTNLREIFILHGAEKSGLNLKRDLRLPVFLGKTWEGKISIPKLYETINYL